MIKWLLVMILLGILSGALSFYRKNYYVGVFNDILGRDEDENPATRVGRGFLYGFFFPVYFNLLLAGIIALVGFLIVAGIIAAVVFVFVWVTEKLLPHDWFGGILISLFDKLGLKGAVAAPAPASEPSPSMMPASTEVQEDSSPPPASEGTSPTEATTESKGPEGEKKD